jgi:SET domain-containing protein
VPGLSGHSDGSGSCYLFRLDDERIVDATLAGCAARFINHCCEPNCYSEVIAIDGEKRILILALKDLKRGDEVTYNYRFSPTDNPRQ